MDVSPKQIVSVGTALIPFLEHDDANRALMGANMQKQAVPLVKAEAPYIGTGVEAAPRRTGRHLMALGNGTVTEVDGDHVTVEYDEKVLDVDGRRIGRKVYLLKFERSNQDTCINQKPVVREGDKVKQGDILANGPSTDNGELALGKNLLVAFMPAWGLLRGRHHPQRADGAGRRAHVDPHPRARGRRPRHQARPRGDPRDIPNLSEEILAKSSTSGGSSASAPRWAPATCWSARSRPRRDRAHPEERLLRAIFGEKAREVRDTSSRCPTAKRARSSTSRSRTATTATSSAGCEPAGEGRRRSARSAWVTSWPAATATRA